MTLRPRVLVVVIGSAALASVFSTSLAYQVSAIEGRPAPMWLLALLNGAFWFGWAVLAAPLTALTRRFRLDRSLAVAVPAHVLGVLLAGAAHVAIQTSARTYGSWRLIQENPDKVVAFAWRDEWTRIFPLQLTALIDWELAIGAGVVGLAHAFFYYRESQQRAVREAQLETRLVEAQLQMLQRQLQPHFLFNTLHAISALMHRDARAADRVLTQLSDLLRLTLDQVAKPEIRLADEVQFLEKYVQIEQVRLGDRLTTTFDIDPQTLDAMVPTLLLQPLVENAIKHGIAPQSGPGRVRVTARRDEDMLIMTVDDTGPGPSERALAALSTGIGVTNTRARLTHQFGPGFRFEFHRQSNGFRVLVAIPFRVDVPTVVPAHVA
jgi:two-component system LytT family sensor kinase